MPPDDAIVNEFSTWKIIHGPLEPFTTLLFPSNAEDLLTCLHSPPFDSERWAFRGQTRAEWGLRPGIERHANMPQVAEQYIEREFKRRAHHYLRDLPDDRDDLEWLALMQHYGAPTRLLDWTNSAYIAAFFAAETASSSEPFAVWAIDRESMRSEAQVMLGLNDPDGDNDLGSRKNFRRLYRDVQPDGLYLTAPVQPYRMNERLTIQQGLFLFPNNPLINFETNLKSLLHYANKRRSEQVKWLYKIVAPPEARLGLLRVLKTLNISSTTLFPGLDGFARSFCADCEILSGRDWNGRCTPHKAE